METFYIALANFNIKNLEDYNTLRSFIAAFCLLKKEVPVIFLSISVENDFTINNKEIIRQLDKYFSDMYNKSNNKLLISCTYGCMNIVEHIELLINLLKDVMNSNNGYDYNELPILYLSNNLNLHVGYIFSMIPEIIEANSEDFTPFNFVISDKVNSIEGFPTLDYLFFKNINEFNGIRNFEEFDERHNSNKFEKVSEFKEISDNLMEYYENFKKNNKNFTYTNPKL